MTRRRVHRRPSELTSLLDVLFLVVFAALIGAKAATTPAAEGAPAAPPEPAAPPPEPPLPPPDPSAAARFVEAIQNEEIVLVAVSADGYVTSIVHRAGTGARPPEDLRIPLLRASDDPEVGIEYRGRDDREHRVCYVVRRELGLEPDLGRALVVITPDRPIAALGYALVRGLKRDAASCLDDANGFAILIDPGRVPGGRLPGGPR